MTRVLIDARITGHDGIGRYTQCLTTTLRDIADPRARIGGSRGSSPWVM
jgi:hypothetical protein